MWTVVERIESLRQWALPDEVFFASGACHMLASAACEVRRDWSPYLILPCIEYLSTGMHVYISDGVSAFDWRGDTSLASLLHFHEESCRASIPSWHYTTVKLTDNPAEFPFCRKYLHRHFFQFADDPLARARNYIAKKNFLLIENY